MNIIITGGSQGIGLACARRFAKDGHTLALVSRSKNNLALALASLDQSKHKSLAVDLTDLEGIKVLEQFAKTEFAPDILVHCIGGKSDIESERDSMKHWQNTFALNLFSIVEANRRLLALGNVKPSLRIIHISSSAAEHGQADTSYACAKTALNRYIRSEGKRLASHGTGLIGIMPAAVGGDGGYWDRAGLNDPEKRSRAEKGQALGRLQTTDEIAEIVSFLAGPSAAPFFGCVLPADANI